jgi:hypothetical protein
MLLFSPFSRLSGREETYWREDWNIPLHRGKVDGSGKA